MNESTKDRLLSATERLLARTREDWCSVLRLWQPLVDREDVDAKVCVAVLVLWYMSAPDRVRGQMREFLCLAAESGHADAIYWTTRYGKKHGKEAYELLIRAAELGSRGAQRDLGASFATGDWAGPGNWAGPKDPARAVYWYRLAAERGHEDAQYNLGFMYILGEGTEANVDEGLRWIHRSAVQGDWSARRLLADLYRNGYYGIPRSKEEAKRWEHLQYVAELKMRSKKKRIRLDELRESRTS